MEKDESKILTTKNEQAITMQVLMIRLKDCKLQCKYL